MSYSRLWTALLLAFTTLWTPSSFSDPIDYTRADRQARIQGPPEENRVVLIALGLGRSSGTLSAQDSKTIYTALQSRRKLPEKLSAPWQQLLRIAQTQAYLENEKDFFSVGYEFEVAHAKKNGIEHFEEGFHAHRDLVAGIFGVKKAEYHQAYDKSKPDGKDFKGKIVDDAGLIHPDVVEWTHPPTPDEFAPGQFGWELVTPPFKNAPELQRAAALRVALANSEYGMSTSETGLHQTNSLVVNLAEARDAKFLGRVAANQMLLQGQFAPALFDLLDIKRNGGFKNHYLRPMVLDHQEMLHDLQHADLSKLDLKYIDELKWKKYLHKEFAVQAADDEDIALLTDPNKRKAALKRMMAWTDEQKRAYKPAWKYRDGQLKILPDIPEQALWELRIGDYVSDRPEITMLQTLIEQKMLQTAHRLAKEGKMFDLEIPERPAGMSDEAYWKLLKSNPRSSLDSFLKEIGISDPNMVALIKGQSFRAGVPREPVSKSIVSFERHGSQESLVNLIVPRDPELRKSWSSLNHRERVAQMRKLGFNFDGRYSSEKARILATEFTADLARFPYLSPDLQLERSGNWKVKSAPHAISSRAQLRSYAAHIDHQVSKSCVLNTLEARLGSHNLTKKAGH